MLEPVISVHGVNVRRIGLAVLLGALAAALLTTVVQLGRCRRELWACQASSQPGVLARPAAMVAWQNSTLLQWGRDALMSADNSTDFKTFSHKLRKYSHLLAHYEEHADPLAPDDTYGPMAVLQELEARLFPWALHYYSTVLQMKRSFHGAGIVIPTGSHHFRMAVFLIRTLRHLGCSLPICIAHAGKRDLQPGELFYLYSLRVTALDISQYVDTDALQLNGWQIKPFAMLYAPFTEVILMDADVVILQDPTGMLRDPEYLQHHAIIFRDRTVFDKDWKKTVWLDNNLPAPLSERVRASRMYNQVSGHEQESGIVVINKAHNLCGLLAACKMNCKHERDAVVYQEFYGDKETFWIGMEMAGNSYTTLWERAGVMGQARDYDDEWLEAEIRDGKIKRKDKKREKDRRAKDRSKRGAAAAQAVCGRILHFDRAGLPLWFNGGIVEDKRDEEKRKYLVSFTHYAHEGQWDFRTSCILNTTALAVPANMTSALQEMGRLWRPKINLLELD